MQRVDGAYLYDFGANMRLLDSIEDKDCERANIYHQLNSAYDALKSIVFQSIFSQNWRVVYNSAHSLLQEIEPHLIDFNDFDTFKIPVYEYQIAGIKTKHRELEAIMRAELQALALFYVSPKGGFDSKYLTESGAHLFPNSLGGKCPEASEDIVMGARCMAFELWTAMGFHFHRANEAVLRRYYDSVIGLAKRSKVLTMGTMVSSMEQHEVGDTSIRAALKNIINFHRNPIAHPEHHIATGDEALSLYAAIRACMGYMLDRLPEVSIVPLEVQATDAAPLLPQTE